MKNSANYATKVKKLISGAKAAPAADEETGKLLLRSILEENAMPKQVTDALARLDEEFLDYNELRVSPLKDIEDCFGRGFPMARSKADSINKAFNVIFDECNKVTLEYLQKKPKRELRKLLREELGLSAYAEAVVTLYGFGGHAIPVDHLLLETLRAEGCIDPESTLDDLQGFLERLVPAKDAVAAHEALRAFAIKTAPKVAKELAKRDKVTSAEHEIQAQKAAAAAAAAEAAIPVPPRPIIPVKPGQAKGVAKPPAKPAPQPAAKPTPQPVAKPKKK